MIRSESSYKRTLRLDKIEKEIVENAQVMRDEGLQVDENEQEPWVSVEDNALPLMTAALLKIAEQLSDISEQLSEMSDMLYER